MSNNPFRICILGGGFGGLYAALYLSNFRRQRENWQITLVEKKDHFLFTPLLYELLSGEVQPWEIAPSYQKLLANTQINWYPRKIQGIDLENRRVNLEEGVGVGYDYLVLAVGCQARLAAIPGAATHALNFRTLADVDRLETKLRIMEQSDRQRLRIAIIGGGANGVELTGKLADRLGKRGQVHLIERGTQILKHFSPAVRSAAYRAFNARGVKVDLETSIQAIEADRITLLRNNSYRTLAVDLAIWTGGIESREWVSNLARCNSQGQLLTRSTLQLVDYPEVFALGDLADVRDRRDRPVPATAQAASQQAAHVAKNIRSALRGRPLKQFRYFYLGDMLTLGKGAAIVYSFGLNIEGALADIIRRLVYSQKLPTVRHRWQVLKKILCSSILNRIGYNRRQGRQVR